jgi:ribosomal protein S18 acetylase RimI-like enzyme
MHVNENKNSTPVSITPIQDTDLSQVVDVHMRAFPDFFLTFLGPRFLKEFYGSFVVDPMGMGFVASDEETGKILGVIVGPLKPSGYFKRLLKRRWWAFCLASMSAVLRRPTAIKRLVRAVFYRGEAPSGPEGSLLSSIAVDTDAQGRGVGKLLVQAWLAEAQEQGAATAFLTTDAIDNEATNRFYQKLGWRIESVYETPEGRKMNRYVIGLSPCEA